MNCAASGLHREGGSAAPKSENAQTLCFMLSPQFECCRIGVDGVVGGPGQKSSEPEKSTGGTLEPRGIEKLYDTNIHTPPTENPGKRLFPAPKRFKLFILVWLLDQYSNLFRMVSEKFLKKVISSKNADI